ncbi:MAG: hypothetical protein ACPIOQ_06885 [Promethearchaeia archaeon]
MTGIGRIRTQSLQPQLVHGSPHFRNTDRGWRAPPLGHPNGIRLGRVLCGQQGRHKPTKLGDFGFEQLQPSDRGAQVGQLELEMVHSFVRAARVPARTLLGGTLTGHCRPLPDPLGLRLVRLFV